MSRELKILVYFILLLATIAIYQNPDLNKAGLFDVFKTETADKSGERITRKRLKREPVQRKRAKREVVKRKRVKREVVKRR